MQYLVVEALLGVLAEDNQHILGLLPIDAE